MPECVTTIDPEQDVLRGQVASSPTRIDECAHRRRREECFTETFVVHQGICQGENRRAAQGCSRLARHGTISIDQREGVPGFGHWLLPT